MLSHLRFHRRGPASTPSSPVPDQNPPSPVTLQHPPLSADPTAPSDAFAPSPATDALPPILPPIKRVTSAESEPLTRPGEADMLPSAPASARSAHQQTRSPNPEESGFLGGLALQNYRRDVEAQPPLWHETIQGSSSTTDPSLPRTRPALPAVLSQPEMPTRPPPQPTSTPKSATSFASPTELQNSTSSAAPASGRRPAGARLMTEPPAAVAAAHVPEPHKSKKSLPFLKNPMSTLLMRRKNSHHAPDILPLPLSNEGPVYDPRIRGTRVHDFSAPRRKQQTSRGEASLSRSPTKMDRDLDARRRESSSPEKGARSERPSGNTSSASASVVSQTLGPSTSASSRQTKMSADHVPQMPDTAPPVPPKDQAGTSLDKSDSRQSRRTLSDVPSRTRSINSLHSATQSRKPSVAGASKRDTMSSLPRHMKSTSSRFSFDMIGAAKQEKLLEERHRQREAEKQANDPKPGPRDSQYDDFDEDAMYEAMMEDDDEEPIPGMDADDYDEDDFVHYEDEDGFVGDPDDPDNDQENFEGFVFERSNPNSELATPQHALETPRDAAGQVIGFAMTGGDTPRDVQPLSPMPPSPLPPRQPSPLGEGAGLGIQGIGLSAAGGSDAPPPPPPAGDKDGDFSAAAGNTLPERDELDFGSGVMKGFENEFAEDLAADPTTDGAPFDESIFDNNDTDQYGRPIAGAFANALSVRQKAQPEALHVNTQTDTVKAEADEIAQPQIVAGESPAATSSAPGGAESPDKAASSDPMAAYQAALSAAAFKAAASGKFSRDDASLEKDALDTADDGLYPEEDNRFDPDAYEDDEDDFVMSFDNGLDDYELDDDAIIAEANASALASDSDGWYGTEFGFYSAPAGSYGSYASTSSEHSSAPSFEYANGGYFGPRGANGGVSRTKSGRVLNREANLTPITERSEYSNRNSVMSLVTPMATTPGVTSPGLAQLVMMADRDDQMSLSALMRLRSKAWGGSQLSLSSSREGSPRSERGEMLSAWAAGGGGGGGGGGPGVGVYPGSLGGSSLASQSQGHRRMNSVISTASRGSDGPSAGGSPTLTGLDMACSPPQPTSAPPPVPTFPASREGGDGSEGYFAADAGLSHNATAASTERTSMTGKQTSTGSGGSGRQHSGRSGGGHRHKTSAESISYVHEQEEGTGESKWVIERRRTGESGREILEREVVEGGRI